MVAPLAQQPTVMPPCTAGNIEALYTSWVDQPAGNCPMPASTCVTKQAGRFCPLSQPSWSAYR